MGDVNFIASITLGKIQNWANKKVGKLTPVTFPTRDSGWVEAVDEMGIFETIDFSGRWTGKFETIQGYISLIKGIADGAQTSSVALQSPFVNTRIKVGTGSTADTIKAGTMGVNTSVSAGKLVDSVETSFITKGIIAGDIVKNLTTGNTATVSASGVAANELTLSSDIFPVAGGTGVPYAVTATIQCKILNIDVTWELPALSICNYKITVVQVAF